jgi:type VI secretion system secreted protein VgrG
MAVKRRVNWVSQQRVDVPDMRSIESAASNDFDELMQTLYLGAGEGYIFRGFDISMAGLIGGAASGAQMIVDQAAILHSKSKQSGTFLVVRPGTPPQVLNAATNTNVVGAFSPSSLNYVGIEYIRFIDDTTASQVYIWDPTINDETTKVIPRAQILKYQIVITTGTWAANVLPVCTITTDAGNNVLRIEDNRRLMMRLGTAGRTTPNPFYSYPWTAQTEGRVESPFISSSNSINPFHGGDKMLGTEKDWKDAIMSAIKEVKGSAFWYSAGSSSVAGINLTDLFFDSPSGSLLTMRGKFIHSKVTPGMLTWTGILNLDSIVGNLRYTVPAGSVTLADKQVAYIVLNRNTNFQPTNTFTFTIGSPTVTATSLVAGIFPGDFIVFFSDSIANLAEVQSISGNTITLVSPYGASGGSPPPGSPNMGTSANYGILAATAITNSVGTSVVNGDFGEYPGGTVTGAFTISGATNLANAAANTAQNGALVAYTDLSTRTSTIIPSILDGQVLTAGVYSFTSGAATLAASGPGTLTFNGSATDIFVIQTASTLTTGAGGVPTISLTGGALASNVYWAVGSSATINSGSAGTFVGTIIAQASITNTLGGTVNGRLIALTGAVTLSQATTINVPSLVPIGASETGIALSYTGAYTVQVADPNMVPANGNVYWIAKRDDNGSITATISASPVGAVRVSGVTTFQTTAAHGINAGQGVQVAGVTNTTFNGFFEVLSTPSPTTFTVTNTGLDATSGSGTVNSTATIYLRGIGELTQGSSSSDDSSTIEAMLQYMGSAYAGDTQPQYGSTNYVTQGIDLTDAISQLDAQAGTGTLLSEQDRNLKLVLGGVWAETVGIPTYTLVSQLAAQTSRISTDSSVERVAQPFTPSSSGNLGKVTLYPRKVGTASGTFVIEIRADSAGSPGSLLATSAPINIATLPTSFPAPAMDIIFSSPPAVTASTQYWIVENPAGATVSVGNTLDLNDNSGSPNLSFSVNSGVSYVVQAGTALEYQAYTVVGGSGASLTWSADAFIQIPNLANSVNRIPAGSVNFTAFDQVAYVELNRVGPGGSLSALVVANASLVPDNNTLIFARFLSDSSIIVGTHSFRLIPGESKELDAGMSIENRTLLGIIDEANGSAHWNTVLGAPLFTIPTDNSSVVAAVASMDTELSKLFGQMRLTASVPPDTRVHVSASDVTMLNGALRSQKISSLLLAFAGAVIDFQTGIVYQADGVTPLGVNFTPVVIPANQYQWYSVSVIPNSSTSDGKLSGQLLVLPGNGTGATALLANKAPFPSNGIPLGEVVVQENGAATTILPIVNPDIVQLGIGSGSGSGSGDTTDFLTRMEIWHDDAPYEFLTPFVFETDIDTDTFSSSAPFDYATNSYKLSTGQNWTSINMLDPEFVAEGIDVVKVAIAVIYNRAAIDPNPTVELSRDGGTNYQSFPVTRTSPSSDSFLGELVIQPEPTPSILTTYPLVNATALEDLNTTTQQDVSQPFVLATTSVVSQLTIYDNKLGSPAGNFSVSLVRDNGSGSPSLVLADRLVTSNFVSIGGLSAGNNTSLVPIPPTTLPPGTYHIVIETDAAYKASYSVGVNAFSIRVNSGAGPSPFLNIFNGTSWTIVANTAAVYVTSGRIQDVRIRITSSITSSQLAAVGLLYSSTQPALGGIKNREVFVFSGDDNLNTFTLTTFLPDPDLLMIYELATGQVYMAGSGSFTISGGVITFPANTFNKPGETVTLVAIQSQGASFDNSDFNGNLLAANNLGSTDPAVDRSVAGHGIFLRRPDGTLREIAIDNNDNIVIYSV